MSRRHSSPALPLEDEDLLQEILLRLPPQPSSLPRASAVCRRWSSILSDPEFLKRFRKHHRKPPLLDFFAGKHFGTKQVFTPVLDPPDHIRAVRFSVPKSCIAYDEHWDFMGCHHGLAVLANMSQREIAVWDPLTGQQHCVTCPPGLVLQLDSTVVYWQAAVLCTDAEDGHVHDDCFSSPLKLVLIWVIEHTQVFACLYESASGVWGDIVSMECTNEIYGIRPGILVRNALCWLLFGGDVLVFGLQSQSFGVIKKPVDALISSSSSSYGSIQLLRADGSGLGLAYLSELTIQLWERKSNCDGVVRWVFLQKNIQLEELFPQRMFSDFKRVVITGYDEDTNVIVISTITGVFMLQLDSMQIKHIIKRNGICYDNFHPYTISILQEGDLGGNGWIWNCEHMRSANVLSWLNK